MPAPIRVAVTGAAGNIGYSLLWRIAGGDCFGPDQPVILQLLEVPQVMDKLAGVVMELEDSASPLVHGIVASDDPKVAFNGANQVFLVGSRPRSGNMNRSDLVAANGPIFVGQGNALNAVAASDVRIIVVGNPCNTNAMIACANARDIPDERFSAMTRLDQNRSVAQIANKLGVPFAAVRDVFVWGNHSDAMYPDISLGTVNGEPLAPRLDPEWLGGDFVKTVATRGKAIITARGASSAASAASSATDHMHDWFFGSRGHVTSMAIPSKGWYGVPEGLMFSFPVRIEGGEVQVVEDLVITDHTRAMIQRNIDDLLAEKAAVADLL